MSAVELVGGLVLFIGICWACVQAGLLSRGLDYTSDDNAYDDARIDTIRDELDRQEMKPRKVRAI